MSRLARIVVPGAPHHVTQRGNRRQPVFFEDGDYRHYLALLGAAAKKAGTQVWAYCLMPNHVHLILLPAHGDGLRATLGTIPSYSEGDVSGLPISGVTRGGPAESAGLRGGDRVVEVAGGRIENIYDYTYAIDALVVGEPVGIVVLRDGERLSFEITPASRE